MFGHVERMDERRLTKESYDADLGGNAGRGRRIDFIFRLVGLVKNVLIRVLRSSSFWNMHHW
jgi:hypothetical protein